MNVMDSVLFSVAVIAIVQVTESEAQKRIPQVH